MHKQKPGIFETLPANISCFPRRLQRNNFCLSRPLEDILKTYLQYVFMKYLQEVLQDVFKTFSRRLQDVFARRLAIMSWRRLGRQKNITLKTSWRRFEDVFSTSSPRRMFARHFSVYIYNLWYYPLKLVSMDFPVLIKWFFVHERNSIGS